MTALLTDNLPLLAGAPNGIKKLRELILELAVRGKLVPQDPSDEPASELLKRIAEEKARLVAEGKIRKPKPLAKISEEKPFELPAGWEWSRLGELGLIGSSSRVHQKDWQASGVPFYRAREIVRLAKDGFVDNELFISEKLYQELSTGGSVPESGDIMLTGVGTIGVPYRVRVYDRFYFKDASVLIFKNYIGDNSDYLLKYFESPLWVNTIHSESMGTTVHTLTIARANETPCPLPPLAEQHRIVAKVDELMALCDRLEAQQADAESAHAQLVQAMLGSLTQAADAEDFAASWHRLAENFHTLFTTESSIDALKQTLLQLAVMGKLVPQDPNDEPASELLKRIAKEKARLVAEGKLKKQKPLAEIDESEMSFEPPSGWKWQRFAEFALDVSTGPFGSLIHQSDYVDGGVPLVNPSHMVDGRVVADSSVSLLPERAVSLDSYRLSAGDIVMARRGEVGRAALVTEAEEGWLCGTGSFVLRFTSEISRAYVWILFRCHSVRTYLAGAAVGTTMVNLNHGILLKMPIAVPPIIEQHRIVAKVDQLMALCDQLKTRLTQARQLNEQLATALVEQAVA